MMAGTQQDSQPEDYGVSGWLLLLCIILAVVYPASVFRGLYQDIFPELAGSRSATQTSILGVYSLLLIGTTAFSFIAGLKLWLIKPGAVGFAKSYFMVHLASHFAYFVFWITIVSSAQPLDIALMALYQLVRPMGTFAIWYSYLQHSRRVRATYSLG